MENPNYRVGEAEERLFMLEDRFLEISQAKQNTTKHNKTKQSETPKLEKQKSCLKFME